MVFEQTHYYHVCKKLMCHFPLFVFGLASRKQAIFKSQIDIWENYLKYYFLQVGFFFSFFPENQIYLLHSTLPRSTPPTDPTEAMRICLLRGLFLIRAAVHFLRDGDGGEWRGATTGRKREGKITREEVEETREDNFELILFTFNFYILKLCAQSQLVFMGIKHIIYSITRIVCVNLPLGTRSGAPTRW